MTAPPGKFADRPATPADVPRSPREFTDSTAPEDVVPEPTRWLCGTFTIGAPQASHLLGSLPAVIILRGGSSPALEGLEVARRMLVLEMQSPSQGSAVMIARILDLIFIQPRIQKPRRHAAGSPATRPPRSMDHRRILSW